MNFFNYELKMTLGNQIIIIIITIIISSFLPYIGKKSWSIFKIICEKVVDKKYETRLGQFRLYLKLRKEYSDKKYEDGSVRPSISLNVLPIDLQRNQESIKMNSYITGKKNR